MRRTSAIALREGIGICTGENRDTVLKAERDLMSISRNLLMRDVYGGGLLGDVDSRGFRRLKAVRESTPFEKMIDDAEADADDKDPQSPKIPTPSRNRRSGGGEAKKKAIRQVPFRESTAHPPTDGC